MDRTHPDHPNIVFRESPLPVVGQADAILITAADLAPVETRQQRRARERAEKKADRRASKPHFAGASRLQNRTLEKLRREWGGMDAEEQAAAAASLRRAGFRPEDLGLKL